MPGLAGCSDLPPDTSTLTRFLPHEPCYPVRELPAPPDGAAVPIEQRTGERLAGAACRAGVAGAGFNGEFYGGRFVAAERGDEIAARLPQVLDGSFVTLITDYGRTLLFKPALIGKVATREAPAHEPLLRTFIDKLRFDRFGRPAS